MNARSQSKNQRPASNKKESNKTQKAKLRIISGQWRSRQLAIPDLEGLRPTPDRVRETLFNWINPYVAGASCADLFCGSGALGLEALSRGAKHCTFVDTSKVVTQQMKENLTTLNCTNATTVNQNTLDFLQHQVKTPFDLVFIDPPFRKGWVEALLPLLEEGWLKNNAFVYLEMEKEAPLPDLGQQWHLLKEKSAGQLIYRLYQMQVID